MNKKSSELLQVYSDASNVRRVVERAFSDYTGSLGVRLWDGTPILLGRNKPVATVVVHSAKPVRELLWQLDPLCLAEAYFLGEIDVEGDLDALLAQRTHLQSLTLSVRDRLSLLFAVLFSSNNTEILYLGKVPIRWSKPFQLRRSSKHSKTHNEAAIAFHYDVSNAFYRLWLDEQMIYSCAYFSDPDEGLNQAQRNKLDHICRKLRLKPGERFLDIGCGWGALIFWAAQNYGVHAHGITLSRQQYEYTQSKIRELGIESQVTVELRDYRDLPTDGSYDKASSVGMFEHVGLKNLPAYFQIVSGMLKPGGLFLSHGITNEGEGWQKTVGTKFIQRYVFPDGELDSVSNVQREMERTGFEIADVEALRHHYALTLRHWVNRLEARHEEALAHVSEAQYRVWRLYMTACASQFERGAIGIYQILAVNRRDGFADLPLTRGDLYL
jgi:cyclopropane-fatty-acyl-phospholipid synthase